MYILILLILICLAAIAYLTRNKMRACSPCRPLQLIHKLRPALQTTVQVHETDSVDERLDRLAEALADKESRCYRSKFKILSTEQEMAHLGDGPKQQYRSILAGLRQELGAAEVECRRIQGQIEWMSQRRAELNEEVQLSHRMYGRAVTELASNLADLQKGRPLCRPLPQPSSYQGSTSCRTSENEEVECRCRKE